MTNKSRLHLIKSQRWYRQQTESTPYFIYLPCRAVVSYFKSKEKIIWYCGQEETRAYLEQNYIRGLASQHLKKEQQHPGQTRRLYLRWFKNITKKNQSIFKKIDHSDLAKISDRKLLAVNRSLGRQAYKMWREFFMDMFDIDAEGLIEQELVRERVSLSAEEKNILTAQAKPLVYQRQELEILKIAQAVRNNSDYTYLLSRIQAPGNVHRLEMYPQLKRMVVKYLQQYHWIRNSWADVYKINIFEVIEQLNQINSSARDLKSEMRQLKNYAQDQARQRGAIIKKRKLSAWLVRMFAMFSLLALWRDERKEQMQILHYYLELVGTEIGRRSKIGWNKIKFSNPFSIDKLPIRKSVLVKDKNLLKDRQLMYWNGRDVCHFDAKTGEKVVQALEKTFTTVKTEVRGLIACPGKVRGEVVVINKKSDFIKMMPGKILVANMTRPDFLPLMKQAAAIITDEGGITSHAAIVSRELKIPCIIGTQIGTKVLRDGYQVEVNANHGVVLVLGEGKNQKN